MTISQHMCNFGANFISIVHHYQYLTQKSSSLKMLSRKEWKDGTQGLRWNIIDFMKHISVKQEELEMPLQLYFSQQNETYLISHQVRLNKAQLWI